MPQAHQDGQLHSSSSHHNRTYPLSSPGCHKHIKTVSFIPAPATMTELTVCQTKDYQAHQDSQLHSSSSHHCEMAYPLPSQEYVANQNHQLHFTFNNYAETYLLSSQECHDCKQYSQYHKLCQYEQVMLHCISTM
jgi:hypothetical protein